MATDRIAAATTDLVAQRTLTEYAVRHAHPIELGCSTVAHRDLGFCSTCIRLHERTEPDHFAAATELAAWRLLAMAERGFVDRTAAQATAP